MMLFDVYCDESRPDLLSSQNPRWRYLVIGGVWLERARRECYKAELQRLRNVHKIGGEFKWNKVSPSKAAFYKDVIRWFLSEGENLRFRCIAVEHEKVDLIHYHQNDQELGFYKFYYQMLHHWIMDFNRYSIFCDYKRNRDHGRLSVLRKCLECSNISSTIKNVSALHSEESLLIQLADVLTGIVSAKLNNSLRENSAKSLLVEELEHGLKRPVGHTGKHEQKFNVFVIDLEGGW